MKVPNNCCETTTLSMPSSVECLSFSCLATTWLHTWVTTGNSMCCTIRCLSLLERCVPSRGSVIQFTQMQGEICVRCEIEKCMRTKNTVKGRQREEWGFKEVLCSPDRSVLVTTSNPNKKNITAGVPFLCYSSWKWKNKYCISQSMIFPVQMHCSIKW